MQTLIDTVTSFYGAGNAPTRKLFKLSKGPYAGRQMLLYSQSASVIKFCYADLPYSSWSEPIQIADDASDYPVSGFMNDAGDVFVIYSKAAALELVCRKLQFVAGCWVVGDEVVVYNDKDNYFPSIAGDSSGRLHLAWTCYDSAASNYKIHYKYSTDGGATWGGGPTDPGDALTNGSSGCYARFIQVSAYLYCVYTDEGTLLAYRSKAEGAAMWGGVITLYEGSGLDDALSVAVSGNGSLLGIAFGADGKLWFMEYDLQNWSSPFQIAADIATPPLLRFNASIPVVVYGVSVGEGQIGVRYRYKNGSGFTDEANLHDELATFAYVMLYDADGSPAWQNLTSAASNDNPADVYHPISGKLLHAVGDAVYLGSGKKFATLSVILSTVGDSGAEILWYYFNGSQWTIFEPTSGAFSFDASDKLVRLWQDENSAPVDWQKCAVDGKNSYWIKAEVTTAFATAPVGSQLTPLVDIKYINQ